MTPKERRNPSIINASRKVRIANGAGVRVQDVNALLKQFEQMRAMMKQFFRPRREKDEKKQNALSVRVRRGKRVYTYSFIIR